MERGHGHESTGYCRDRPSSLEEARVLTLQSVTLAYIDQFFAISSPVTYAKQVRILLGAVSILFHNVLFGLFSILTETTEPCSVSSCLQSKFNFLIIYEFQHFYFESCWALNFILKLEDYAAFRI